MIQYTQAASAWHVEMVVLHNLSKKEDAKVPQCPPEKEAAIVEALKYFGMISL